MGEHPRAMPKRAAEGGSDWAAGDSVLVNGRAAVVTKDMRPKHNRATVKWSDTGELEKKIDADTIQPRGNQAEEPSAKHSKIEPDDDDLDVDASEMVMGGDNEKWVELWMDNDCDLSVVPPEHRESVLHTAELLRKVSEQMGGSDEEDEDGEDEDIDAAIAAAGDEDEDEEETPQQAAFTQIQEEMKGQLFMFEPPYDDSGGDLPTESSVLARKHLLLPKVCGMIAKEINHSMRRTVYSWEDGGTALGNPLWEEFLLPHAQQANAMVTKEEWQLALGELFGMLLFAVMDDTWLQDNEVHDVPEFDQFFKDFSTAWKSVLAQSDQVLGLKDKKYRSEVKELLQRFKKSTNETLKQKYQKKALVKF